MHHNASWVLSACVHGDSPCFSTFQCGLLDKMLDRWFNNLLPEAPGTGSNRRPSDFQSASAATTTIVSCRLRRRSRRRPGQPRPPLHPTRLRIPLVHRSTRPRHAVLRPHLTTTPAQNHPEVGLDRLSRANSGSEPECCRRSPTVARMTPPGTSDGTMDINYSVLPSPGL